MSITTEEVDQISWCLNSGIGWADLYKYSIVKYHLNNYGVSAETARELITEIKRNK